MNIIIISTLIVAILGILIGILLGIFSDIFKVEVDENINKIRESLPGNNCGSCGYAGCDACAEAISKKEAPVTACPVGGQTTINKISKIMGIETGTQKRKVAFVSCNGTCENVKKNYEYIGNKSCALLVSLANKGEKACEYACIGYGDCVNKCQFNAISIVDGVAVVDKEKCTSCSLCIKACPMNVISLVDYDKKVLIRCNNHNKGKEAKEKCSTSCIACKICEENCPSKAIIVIENLSNINYEKCTDCGECAEKCPQKVIITNH